MKFLCLAYGDEDGWNTLTEEEQRNALARDAAIRDRGNFMSAVRPEVTSVRSWDGNLEVTDRPNAEHPLPLAGFSLIEADSVEEVVELVTGTPCARARGAIDIRPLWELDEDGAD